MKSELSMAEEEYKELVRSMKESQHLESVNDPYDQTSIYLQNNGLVHKKNEHPDEFNLETFKKIDSKKKTDYYKFKKPVDISMTDMVYMLYKEKPTTYGLLTKDGDIAFGLDMMFSVANDNQKKPAFTNVNQFDGIKAYEVMKIIERLTIFLLHVGDINCMRLVWINALKNIIEKYRSYKMAYPLTSDDDFLKEYPIPPMRYIIISDLALIYRPNIDVKLVELAKESKVNIIAFINA